MSEAELAEWAAFYRLEPWGPERADLNAAIIASTIANCHRNADTKPEPFAPSDFMPRYGEPQAATEEEAGAGMEPERIKLVMEGFMRRQEARVRAGLG